LIWRARPWRRVGYYGLCAAADENPGRLLDELDAIGLVKDTIVVFTSDHGQMLWSHGVDEINLPFEESARIPFIVRYPRVIPVGATYDGLISNTDFAPALMAL
jgi:arylsulfatase A-like enzyme